MTYQRSTGLGLNSPEDAPERANPEESAHHAASPWFKKKRLILPLSVVVLMLIIWAASGGGDSRTSSSAKGAQPTVTSAPNAKTVAGAMGTKVRDGKFDFVVTGVERPGKLLAGKNGEMLTAQGEFVIVRVNVTNVGKDPQAPDCSCQLLLTDKGWGFEPSPAILSTKDALKFVQLIEPGNTVNGVLMLFDVAPGTNVVNLELHDSPSSPGVKIKLS